MNVITFDALKKFFQKDSRPYLLFYFKNFIYNILETIERVNES